MTTKFKIIVSAVVLSILVSCKSSDTHYFLPTIIRKEPVGKPFVYKTNIKLTNKLSKTEKTNLMTRLQGQLEDSVNPKVSQKILYQVIKKPPIFDTTYVNNSIKFMHAALNSAGYFHHLISYDTILLPRPKDQQRIVLNFNVNSGPVTIIDSLWFNIGQPELQKLADSTRADSLKKQKIDSASLGVQQPFQRLADSTSTESFLKKGMTFSQDTIGMEFNRLVELYRNNGFLRFTRNELIGVWDTLDATLLQPTTNPIEQIQLLNEIAKRKEHPTATLEITLRPGYDSTKLVKYYVGDIIIYPDYGIDTLSPYKTTVVDSHFIVRYHEYLFKPRIFPPNIYFNHGDVYNQGRYMRTVNTFNGLVAWSMINIEQKPRPGTDTVDFIVRLIPAKKFLFVANLESSRNSVTGQDVDAFAQGNLFGIGANVSVQNRNFARSASQTNTILRYGTELELKKGQRLLHSRQASIGYNIFIPRGIPKGLFKKYRDKYQGNVQTVLAFNVANTHLIDYYNLTTFNTSWGYQIQSHNTVYGIRFPNIEYALLKSKPKLDTIFMNHPGLRNLFNDGLVASTIFSVTHNWGTKRNINSIKGNLELSGLLAQFIKTPFIQKNIYRFIKTDGEYKHQWKTGNSAIVSRTFVGIGIPLGFRDNKGDYRSDFLPFFKAYGEGGPNSMRGWGLRRLGPGSAKLSYDVIPDRFGDLAFEQNIEYRFHGFNFYGFNVNGAFFTDVGNVWFMHKNDDFPNGNLANVKQFFRDLAVDAGTGVRVDIGFNFMIRIDYAFKVVNPSPEPINEAAQYKWFYGWSAKTLRQGTVQFGVTYPF